MCEFKITNYKNIIQLILTLEFIIIPHIDAKEKKKKVSVLLPNILKQTFICDIKHFLIRQFKQNKTHSAHKKSRYEFIRAYKIANSLKMFVLAKKFAGKKVCKIHKNGLLRAKIPKI